MLYTESQNALVQSVYEQHKALAELEFLVGGELSPLVLLITK